MAAGLGALIGGAGGLVGSIIGAQEQAEANRINEMTNVINFWLQNQMRFDSLKGGSDAMGNRTIFDDGWKTILSGQGKGINDAQVQELFKQLLQDKYNQREQLQKNNVEQNEDRDVAEYFRRQLMGVKDRSGEETNILRTLMAQATAGSHEDTLDEAFRNASRRGTNMGPIVAAVGKAKREDMQDVDLEAYTQGKEIGGRDADRKRQMFGNLYSAFAQRAGLVPGASYQPMNITGAADNAGAKYPQMANDTPWGTLDYSRPDTFGSAIVSGSSALGGAFNNLGSYFERQNMQNRMAGGNDWGG